MQWNLCINQGALCSMILNNLRPSAFFSAHLPNLLSTQKLGDLRVAHQAKWHAAAFSTNQFSYLPQTFTGRTSILPRSLWSSSRRGHTKAHFKNSLTLLHQRSIIRPPHYLRQGTLMRLSLSTPPNGQKTLLLSVIRFWMLMMIWNHPFRISLWFTLLQLTHC